MITRLGLLTVVLLAIAFTGCGGASQAQIDEAKSLVQQSLDAWEKGGKAADLKSLSQPVDFMEGSWQRGDILHSYELKRAYYDSRARVIRCEATLVLQAKRARKRTEEVVYEVTLGSPAKIVLNPMP